MTGSSKTFIVGNRLNGGGRGVFKTEDASLPATGGDGIGTLLDMIGRNLSGFVRLYIV